MIRTLTAGAAALASFAAAAHGDHGGIGHWHAGDALGLALGVAIAVAGAAWFTRRR